MTQRPFDFTYDQDKANWAANCAHSECGSIGPMRAVYLCLCRKVRSVACVGPLCPLRVEWFGHERIDPVEGAP